MYASPQAGSTITIGSFRRVTVAVAYGAVGRGVGLLELALGRRSQAERRLREAIALCERMDARAYLAMTRLDLGALLHPSIEGRRLLDQALTAADELGMTSLAKRAPTTLT